MSVTQQALTVGRAVVPTRPRRSAWFGGVHGADYVWAAAFALPYVAVFFAFVLYPICYGLWLGSQPELYAHKNKKKKKKDIKKRGERRKNKKKVQRRE